MSIPPLVCSTPPPPDQCDDDKDQDYDFQYNLQPEDDEDSLQYNYCHYSSRHIYEGESDDVGKIKSNEDIDIKKLPDSKLENNYCEISNTVTNVSIGDIENPEENTVEDLNLMVSEIVLVTHNLNVNKHEIDTTLDKDSCKETSIQDQGGTDTVKISDDDTNDVDILPEASQITNTVDNFKSCGNNIIENAVDSLSLVDNIEVSENNVIGTKSTINDFTTLNIVNEELETQIEPVVEDEFEDFDDFQFTTANESVINDEKLNTENPWENRGVDYSELADFQANFDNHQTVTEEDLSLSENIVMCEDAKNELKSEEDDFGDFDDFQSSANKSIVQMVPDKVMLESDILNISSSSSDFQVIENVNSVLSSIFLETISEPDTKFNINLESVLGETWGHLIDTDVRQPYMVYWNNSLGQKIMLKALCIDSRNILFGPKWNMPKYAMNLGAAPLQPQKQQSQLHVSNTDSIENTSSRDSNTWTDPFTAQGQEYTYAEALLLDLEHLMATLDQMAHKHSTLKISELLSHACNLEEEKPEVKPKHANTFTSEIPTNMNKIYSSTLSVQPLRQINLPDTHIFTPTDSETPRSKTIHYDSSPSNIASKPDLEGTNDISQPKNSLQLDNELVVNSPLPSDNEDWDFQGFKGNTDSEVNSVQQEKTCQSDKGLTPSKDCKTQLLQPIKLEPVIPTLNWPDPGEVKETFYDFSEFVSSTSWSDSKLELPISNHESLPSTVKPNCIMNEDKIVKSENIEEEFETFQSAPALTTSSNFTPQNITQIVSMSSETLSNELDYFNKTNLTPENNKRLNDLQPQSQVSVDNYKANNNKNVNSQTSSLQTSYQSNAADILQPSNAGSVSATPKNQQNSVQILQPLSLESYSQINWPNPGIDLQDLSRFNPIESVHSLKSDTSISGPSKVNTPVHNSSNITNNDVADDEMWGDFVSSAPKPQLPIPKTMTAFVDDDEWTDFVSSPNIKPQNGLSTISLNVHTNLNLQKSNQIRYSNKSNQPPNDIPTLNYITPKSNNRSQYTEKHFQNL